MAIPVLNYEDYLVYQDGRIWSNKTNKFLKASTTDRGYKYVQLFNTQGYRNMLVHRLVAMAYIPNPKSLPQINHKDENPANNHVSNLEWCDAKYNMNYGRGAKTRHSKIDYTKPSYRENAIRNGKKVSKPVKMVDDYGQCLAIFESAVEASRHTGIYKTNISRSAKSDHLKAGGYKWEYAKGE